MQKIPTHNYFLTDWRGCCIALLLTSPGIAAQSLQTYPSNTQPNRNTIQLPNFTAQPEQPGTLLPPIALPQPDSSEALYAGNTFLLRAVVFTGNTVFSDDELNQLSSDYVTHEIDLPQLQALRDNITRHYIEQGYINSGAILPKQTINDGVVNIQIIEGQLSTISIENNSRFKNNYFSERLQQAAQPAVNINTLQQRLYRFQQDPRIKHISAGLKPGASSGDSILNVQVKENPPISIYAEINNHHTPAIGAEGIYVNWRHGNLFGNGETLSFGVEATEGLRSADAFYESPLNAGDTSLAVFIKANESDVIEGEFESLNIESRSNTVGITLTQPIIRNLNKTFDWFVTTELRESESFLLGEGFSFSPGPETGVSKLTVLRTGADLQLQSPKQVLAFRATVSAGIDAFDATVREDAPTNSSIPDGEFTSVLLQGQWAQRLSLWQSTVIARLDIQLSDSPLLGLEQFAVGGHNTVRGYRENSLVHDEGNIASLEWRIPYINNESGSKHELAIFTDAGSTSNVDRDTLGVDSISSVGLGLVGQFHNGLQYQLYWANALDDLIAIGEKNLQDDGVHVRVGYRW